MIYTINNPKLVERISSTEENNFTGVVKDKNGDIAYYENGECHRTDGPAFICVNGYKQWRINGKLHREDGPAIEYPSGEKEWFYNGKIYGEDDDFTIDSWTKKWKLEVFK